MVINVRKITVFILILLISFNFTSFDNGLKNKTSGTPMFFKEIEQECESDSDNGCRSIQTSRSINRGTWKDTFDIESRIESKENVNIINGDVKLKPVKSFIFTTTSDFEAGIKSNIETHDDYSIIPEGEIQLKFANLYNDDFSIPDGDADTIDYNIINSVGPNWINDISTAVPGKLYQMADSESPNYSWAIVNTSAKYSGDFIATVDVNYLNYDTQYTGMGVRFYFEIDSDNWIRIARFHDSAVNNGNDALRSRINIAGSDTHNTINYPEDVVKYRLIRFGDNVKAYYTTNGVDFIELYTRNGFPTGAGDFGFKTYSWNPDWGKVETSWDNYSIKAGYCPTGTWQSATQYLPESYLLNETKITFAGLAQDISEINKIEWLVDNTVMASYGNDIDNNALSPFSITDDELTSGSFKNINANFTIKIYLSSEGTITPIIKQIEGDIVPLKGSIISTPITLYQNEYWDKLAINKTVSFDSIINVSILDPETNQTLPGYENLTGTNIDLTNINPKEYLSIKLRADFISDGEFFPILHDWTVTWEPDYPKLIQDIPSNYSFDEDTTAPHLIYLGFYFQDLYDGIEDLTFLVNYESDPSHIHATVDGKYLDFTAPTINWSGYETFKVKCTDEGGLAVTSNEFKVTVNEVNDPPAWTPIVYIHILEDSQLVEIVDLDKNITDCDDILENISYNLISNNNEANIFVQVVNRKVFAEPLIENYVGSAIIKIRADDGYAIANISFLLIVDPVNDKPIVELLSPGNNMIITTSTVKLSWSEGFDVDSPIFSYDVYLDDVSPPQTLVSNDQTVMSFTIQLEDGTYYWSVIPYDGIEEGDWDEEKIWAFTIITEPDEIPTPPPTITLGTPYNNSIINTDNVELIWNANNSFSDLIYLVYFDTWPKPNKLIASDITEPRLMISDLTDGVTYYWTVIPVSGSLMGTCSDMVWSFTVQLDFIPEYGITITGMEWLTLNQSESRSINLTVTNEGNVKDIYMPELDSGVLGNNNVRFYDSRNILLDPNDSTLLQIVVTIPEGTPTGFYNISINISSFWGGNDIEATHIIQLKIMPAKIDEPEPTDHEESGNYYLYWIILIIIVILILIVIAVISRKRKRKLEEVLAEKGIVQPGTKDRVLLPDIVSSKGVAPQLGAATGTPGTITPILSPAVVSQAAGQTMIPQIAQPTLIPQLPQAQPRPITTPSVTSTPPRVQTKPEPGLTLDDKLKLLNERLLKGEIDQNLYEKLRKEFETVSNVNVPSVQPKLPPFNVQQVSKKPVLYKDKLI